MATSNSLYNHLLKGFYPPQASSYISVPWNREMHLQWNLFFSNGNNNADLSPQYEYNKASSSSFTDQEEYIALIRSHDVIKSQKRFLPFQAFSSKKTGMAKKKGEKQNTPFRINFGFPFGLKSSNGFSTTNPLGKLLCSPSFQMGKKWTFSFRFERKLDSAYKNGSPLP